MSQLPDDLKAGLDARQLEETIRLVADYGHSWASAAGLAAMSRDLTEQSLRTPLLLVTGC